VLLRGNPNEQSPNSAAKPSAKNCDSSCADRLVPGPLVAQVLAASTFQLRFRGGALDAKVIRFKGDKLGKEVDKTELDPSVKALAQFRRFLKTWTRTCLGRRRLRGVCKPAAGLTDAVQTLRQEARKAGHLNDNEQEK